MSSISGKAGANISAFVAKLDVLREQTQGQTLKQIIELLLEHSQLIEHYQAEREGADRVENLQELVNAAESFVTQEGFGKDAVALPVDEALQSQADFAASQAAADGAPLQPDADTGETLSPLAAFLSHAALEAGDNQAQAGQDAVQLMTVHAAKGLEFDCVFITGLEEGLFPHENAMSNFEGLEEERRLMYVAITRARKRLYLSHSQTRMLHGQTRYNIKSRFFDEMPEHTMKWLTPKTGLQAHMGQQTFGLRQQRLRTSRFFHIDAALYSATCKSGYRQRPECLGTQRFTSVSHQIRRRHRGVYGRHRRRRTRASEIQPPRSEMAGALGR